jgi:WD repeat-containing protein 1 (actin-interacting protein 1)
VFEGHAAKVNAAAISPSGEYVASADATGNVKIWSLTASGHPVKKEHLGLPGGVEDIAWSADGTWIAVVGHGKDKARVFTWESGTNMCAVKTMAKRCLAVAMSPSAPPRALYGGEDSMLLWYSGKPMKLDATINDHTNFINAVAFAPDGSKAVSTGSDKTFLILDGATGAVKHTVKAIHKGAVYAADFNADGSRLVTSSSDKSVKVWDFSGEEPKAMKEYVLGKDLPHMQNGVVWPRPDTIVSVGLGGTMHVFAPDSDASEPKQSFDGHSDMMCTFAHDGGSDVFVSGDSSGGVCLWSHAGGDGFVATRVGGAVGPHKSKISTVAIHGDRFVSGGFDDMLRFGTVSSREYLAEVAVGAQPKSVKLVPTNPDVAVVATSKFVKSFSASGAEICAITTTWEGTSVDVSADGTLAFVGGSDGKVRSFTIDAKGGLSLKGTTGDALRSAVASIAVSPDGKHVAVGDAAKEIAVFDADTLSDIVRSKWTAHTSRVASLAWHPSGATLASVGTDRHLFIWTVSESFPVHRFNLAAASPAHSVAWAASGDGVWIGSINGLVAKFPVPA